MPESESESKSESLPASGAPAPADPAARELTISHTYAEGTTLQGVRPADDLYHLLRSHGWLRRHTMGDYRLQSSVDKPAKTYPINRTAQALREHGFTVAVHVDNTPRPTREAETDRAAAADERAARLAGRAGRLEREALGREEAARRTLDHIPPGQPFLTDHHGYAADRRRRERAWNNQDTAARLREQAKQAAQDANTAASHMDHRHAPETVANRIRRLQADLDRVNRLRGPAQDTTAPSGNPAAGRAAERDAQASHLEDQLRHWREVRAQQIADGVATDYGPDDVRVGDLVKLQGGWHPVARVNPKSVSVPNRLGGSWSDTIRFERLTDHVSPGDQRWAQCALAALSLAPPANSGRREHPAYARLARAVAEMTTGAATQSEEGGEERGEERE